MEEQVFIDSPLVSVNMIAYNVESYIAESIESVISQTFSNWELIIIDDGSTDNTLAIAQGYAQKDSRIKVFANGQNEGIVYTRNRAIHYSQGKYIAVLDSDDVCFPNRLEKQLDFLENNTGFGLIGSAFEIIDKESNHIGEGFLKAKAEYFPIILLFNNFFLHSSVMFLAKPAKDILYRPLVKGCAPGEEYQLFVNLCKRYKAYNLDEKLVKYRELSGGISKVRKDKILEYTDVIIHDQIRDLGLAVDEKLFNIHKIVHSCSHGVKFSEFKLIKMWLNKIYKANLKVGVYNQINLSDYISFRLWEICKFNIAEDWRFCFSYLTSKYAYKGSEALTRGMFLLSRFKCEFIRK